MKRLTAGLIAVLVLATICLGAWDNDKPADNETLLQGFAAIRANNDALEVVLGTDLATDPFTTADIVTKGPWVDIRAFGADATDAVDDTAAIQAAIDAATSVGGIGILPVYIPPSLQDDGTNGFFMISNLTLPPRLELFGAGMHQSNLKAITGTTGILLEDVVSAQRIILRDFTLWGNNVTATGIDLGNNTTQWGGGYIHNVKVRDLTGIGMNLNVNASWIGRVNIVDTTTAGMTLTGSTVWINEVWITGTSSITDGMNITASEVSIAMAHMEGIFTVPIQISSANALFLRLSVSVAASTTITDAVVIDSGKTGCRIINFNGLTAKSGAVITNFVTDNQYSVVIPYIATQVIQSYDQEDFIKTLADEATPTVVRGGVFVTGGTTTITDFDDGHQGQIITVIAAHTLTIDDQTNIILNGSVDWIMQSGDTLTLIQKADTFWYEIARSNNTTTGYIVTKRVEISSAEIKDLVANPKELVAAPGADNLIEFISAVLVLDFAGGALAEPTPPDDLAIEYDDGTGQQIITWDTTGFIENGADALEIVNSASVGGGAAAVTTAANVNKNIVLINTGGDYTGAPSTSTITIFVTYREHYSLGL